jgi:hypothetical protein
VSTPTRLPVVRATISATRAASVPASGQRALALASYPVGLDAVGRGQAPQHRLAPSATMRTRATCDGLNDATSAPAVKCGFADDPDEQLLELIDVRRWQCNRFDDDASSSLIGSGPNAGRPSSRSPAATPRRPRHSTVLDRPARPTEGHRRDRLGDTTNEVPGGTA